MWRAAHSIRDPPFRASPGSLMSCSLIIDSVPVLFLFAIE